MDSETPFNLMIFTDSTKKVCLEYPNVKFFENKDFKFSLIPAIAIMSVIFNFFISKFDNFYHGFLWNTGWFNIFFTFS